MKRVIIPTKHDLGNFVSNLESRDSEVEDFSSAVSGQNLPGRVNNDDDRNALNLERRTQRAEKKYYQTKLEFQTAINNFSIVRSIGNCCNTYVLKPQIIITLMIYHQVL